MRTRVHVRARDVMQMYNGALFALYLCGRTQYYYYHYCSYVVAPNIIVIDTQHRLRFVRVPVLCFVWQHWITSISMRWRRVEACGGLVC